MAYTRKYNITSYYKYVRPEDPRKWRISTWIQRTKSIAPFDTWAKPKTKPSLQPRDFAKQPSQNQSNTSHTKKQHKWHPRTAANDWSLTLIYVSRSFEDTQLSRNHPVKAQNHHKLYLELGNWESDPTSEHSDFFSGDLDFPCLYFRHWLSFVNRWLLSNNWQSAYTTFRYTPISTTQLNIGCTCDELQPWNRPRIWWYLSRNVHLGMWR